MAIKDQVFRKEYAKELLGIAEQDFETLKVIHQATTGRKENVCFIAQQVCEKALKAVLCHLQQAVPFTYSLELLEYRLPKSVTPPSTKDLEALTEYATIRRYEEGVVELSQEDLDASLDLAKEVLQWATALLSK